MNSHIPKGGRRDFRRGQFEATGGAIVDQFSVVIAAYNAAETVGKAVDSVLRQTQAAREIIVVDDGSTDDTVGSLVQHRNDIKLICQPNRGVNAAHNTAIADATGEFVVLIDADDEWEPTRLERIAEFARTHPEIDLITTEARVIHPDGTTHLYYADSGREFPVPSRQVEAILRRNFIFGGAAIRLLALQRVGGFGVQAPHQAEYELWIRLLVSGSRAGLVREPLYLYHQGAGLHTNVAGTARSTEHVLLRVMEQYQLSPGEIAAAQSQLDRVRRTYTVADAVQALRSSSPDARQKARAVAVDRTHPFRLRAKFAAAAALPGAARLLAGDGRAGSSALHKDDV